VSSLSFKALLSIGHELQRPLFWTTTAIGEKGTVKCLVAKDLIPRIYLSICETL